MLTRQGPAAGKEVGRCMGKLECAPAKALTDMPIVLCESLHSLGY